MLFLKIPSTKTSIFRGIGEAVAEAIVDIQSRVKVGRERVAMLMEWQRLEVVSMRWHQPEIELKIRFLPSFELHYFKRVC